MIFVNDIFFVFFFAFLLIDFITIIEERNVKKKEIVMESGNLHEIK